MDQRIQFLAFFSLVINIVGGISNCTNLHLGNHEGTIQSPGYPNPYPDFVQCSWFVDIPRNSSLSISILDLDVENEDSPSSCNGRSTRCCTSSWLSISSPNRGLPPHPLCNGVQISSDILLPNSLKIATIKFHSSKNSKFSRGFKLRFVVVPNVAKRHPCLSTEFSCSNGRQCIQQAQICDGNNDCADKSDESHCDQRCTVEGLKSCPDTPSVCYNASINACSRLMSCPASRTKGWTPCKDGKACYLREQRCDQTVDCDDQTDELDCQAEQSRDVFFLCDDWSKWIPNIKVCDGNVDCGDRSDEECCVNPSLETAIIVGCLSCCLIFILLTSYFFFGYGQPIESHSSESGADPPLRSMLNISGPSYLMFREPPPPYFAEPPPSRRRFRRHRRHPRVSLSPDPATNNPVLTAPGSDVSEAREVPVNTMSEAFKAQEDTPSVSSA